MRLSDAVLTLIRQAVSDLAGPDCKVRLFGSRLNDAAKGGDMNYSTLCAAKDGVSRGE